MSGATKVTAGDILEALDVACLESKNRAETSAAAGKEEDAEFASWAFKTLDAFRSYIRSSEFLVHLASRRTT